MKELAKNEENKRIVPSCAILEDNGKIILTLEMPGIAKEDLEIHVERNELSVSGKRPNPATTGDYLIRERRWGDYQKVFSIDPSIDTEKIDASMANGIVTLTLPIREAAKPRKIAIK